MFRAKLPPAVPLLVLSGLYLISLGCGTLLPGNLPLPAPSNGSAGAVSISPQKAALSAGNSLQFTATSYGLPTTDLEWMVNGVPGGSSASGTISGSGLYTAPQQVTSNVVIVVAVRSKTEPTKDSSATITVLSGPAPIGPEAVLSITPTSASVPTAGMQLFTASVTGTSNTVVTWGLSGRGCSGSSCGTLSTSSLSESAVYLAPSVAPTPASVNVIATSVVDPTKSASAKLVIVAAVVVGVTPANVSVTAGATQQFTASFTRTSNTAVAWTVSGNGCSGTACGTISSSGLYTAPAAVTFPATVTTTATSVADPTKSASAEVTIVPSIGTTYYLATAANGGSDSNDGTSSGTPWLTPDHAVNCGDVIIAAASTAYVAANFYAKFGPVTCAAANNVAWLTCAKFDACKISGLGSGVNGMAITNSYWGIQGWEVDGAAISGPCFAAASWAGSTIHHIIFANDIANGCGLDGFAFSPESATSSFDYIAVLGNIAYNNAGGTAYCGTGIEIWEPRAWDSLPGTHIYVAGNFSYSNVDATCYEGGATDGEGIEFDTFDGSQTPATGVYSQQAVADNNMLLANGGPGLEVFNNSTGTGPFANIYFRHNTAWGNNSDPDEAVATYAVGEILIYLAQNVQAFQNIAATNAVDGAESNPIYAYWVSNGNSTDIIYQDVGYAVGGTTGGIYNSTGFSHGPNNLFGTNPNFANAVAPGAPSCGSASSVPNCMASVIANFTPTAAAAKTYGYQIPSSASVYDPLFPQWLCNVNLPAGLVTMGCLSQ